MFKKKRVVLDPQEAIWYSHVKVPFSELQSLCSQKTLQKKKIVKAAIEIYSMSEFTPLHNHPSQTFDGRPEVCGGIVSLTRKAEKILAGEDLDIKPECKQINDHSIKIDSKEIVQNSNHTLFA